MTSRLLLLIFIIVAATFTAKAQDTTGLGWSHEFGLGLNITQSSYSNWVAGAEDTFAWQFSLKNADTLFAENFDWANTLSFDYGQTKIGGDDARKNVDELLFESVWTYNADIFVNPYASVKLRTQVADGFQVDRSDDTVITTKVSALFEPTFLTEAIGLGYSPVKGVNTRLGFAAKQTIADEFAIIYSNDPDTEELEKVRYEYGAQSVTTAKLPLSENISYKGRLELFSDFSEAEAIDVNWDNVLEGKLSDIITVNLNVRLLYDRDINIKRQLAQVLSIGFSYTFW